MIAHTHRTHRPLLSGLTLGAALWLSAAPLAHAGEAYVALGLPIVQVGYAQAVNEHLGLRVDAGATGSIKQSSTESGINFDGKFKYNRLALLADIFPFAGGFRVTAGLGFNQASLQLDSQFDGNTPVTVNGRTVTPDAGDYLNAKLKYPSVMPYLGLGWGHQRAHAGLGFVADIGVSFGKAKLTTSTNLVGKNGVTQADVDAKTAELDAAVGDVSMLPQVSIGLTYRF